MYHVALIACLALGQGESKTVINATSLVDRDWSDDDFALALQPEKEWTSGTAWFFRYDQEVSAWKGKYAFFRPKNLADDCILLQIGFQRRYILRQGEVKDKWALDTRYVPQGMNLEIPLDDSHVPRGQVQFSITGGFWSDSNGEPTTRLVKKDGLLGKLGIDQEVKISWLENADVGDTLELGDDPNKFYKEIATILPPPGFKARMKNSTEPTVVQKPVMAASGHSNPVKDLLNSNPLLRSAGLQSVFDKAMKEKRYDDAVAAADKLLQAAPKTPYYTYLRGLAKENLGQRKEALVDYSFATANSKEPLYRKSLARVAAASGDYRLAVRSYRECAGLDATDADSLNGAAWHLAIRRVFTREETQEGLDLARRACKLREYKDAMTIDTLAAAYARLGEFGPACRAQKEAIRLGSKEYTEAFKARLALYEAGKPYLE